MNRRRTGILAGMAVLLALLPVTEVRAWAAGLAPGAMAGPGILAESAEVRQDPIQVPAVLTGEDDFYGYRYECPGIGGFSSSVEDPQDLEIAVVALDPGLAGRLYRDGREIPFENESLLFDSGSYVLHIYPEGELDSSVFGSFSFTVSNRFGDESGGEPLKVEENPGLDLVYDPAGGSYRYTLPNGNTFSMNVPLGAVTRDMVTLSITDGDGIYELRKDGEVQILPDPMVFTEPGTYQLQLLSSYSGSSLNHMGVYRTTISFVILEELVRDLDILNAPLDFTVTSVVRDRKKLPGEGAWIYLEDDGSYQVSFVWDRDPSVTWETRFRVDRSAPWLIFSENIYEPGLRPPVTFRPSENGCQVAVFRDGVQVPGREYAITNGGTYTISITDEAGNGRSYSFYVAYRSGLWSWTGAILFLVFLAVGALWMLYLRRHMEVL